MKALVDELDKAKAYEQQLTDQYDDSYKKCERAKSLIEKLGDEEVNWAASLKKNKEDKTNLVGDLIISSGVIAYLGVFTLDYRLQAIESWVELMKSF
jgi:dynein heavy chain